MSLQVFFISLNFKVYGYESINDDYYLMTVLVVAHGNSNRSIVMDLDKLSREQVLELNLGTAVPLVYDLSESGEVLGKEIL